MLTDRDSKATRRHFLATHAMGIGGTALAWLLHREGLLASPIKPDLVRESHSLLPKAPQAAPKSRAMISIFMQGGPSHIDLTDPKPILDKYAGQVFPGKIQYDNAAQASPKVLPSFWKFQRHGQCGMELSELLPNLGSIADDVCLIRSMRTAVNNHGQSIDALNSGRPISGRPALGSWLTYGLGSQSDNLPAYMVLRDPANLPVLGVLNWSAGWLPSLYQGTVVRPREPRILNLEAPEHLRGQPQKQFLDLLSELNREHLNRHPGELDLDARIASFELAARMQMAAGEAMDVSKESEVTKRLYGIDQDSTREFGTRCLIARRLVERGVRFVQIFTQNQFWDHHGNLLTALPAACKKIDQPCAALVKDLKSRGLLDSTVVHWGGEMGRLPVIQNDTGRDRVGRDHNTYGFSSWLAGGGIRGGHIHGTTDEWGLNAESDIVHHYDYHATLLHLFGLDHTRLVYKRNAIEQTLTDGQPARVVKEILA
ncbi:MAG: DUF1501 domain-containing protein [Pedosphaera sp.]|nr:DUF1501 domain-containing protein [Pedosphaera sp.]